MTLAVPEKRIDELERKLDLIIEHLGIGQNVRRSRRSIEDEVIAKIASLKNRGKKIKKGHGRETDRTK